MGCWGLKLFQSDHDYDCIGDINDDAGMELYFFENEAAVVAARDALNTGLFRRLLNRYKREPKYSGGYHQVILFTSMAMRTGAILDDDLRTLVKKRTRTVEMFDEAKEQMKVALDEYVSGEPYDFNSPGLIETAMAAMDERFSNPHSEHQVWTQRVD